MEQESVIQIQLTQKEKELFDFLLNFIKCKNLSVTIRTAGGWVRDKILGKESDDIDFAIDNITGNEFIQHFVEYLKEIDQESVMSGIGVVKTNPDQSKHLEVATFKLLGYDIDIVNLRRDDFAENQFAHSLFGTPLSDAKRRDLTINSMFYNLNLGIVEDFTSYGFNDLKNGIIRTPIDPIQTYADDPLRIFRAIRFAVRFQFRIAEEIIDAIKRPEIRDALISKVKRQRIRSELEKILIDGNVEQGLDLIQQNNLWPIAFYIQDIDEKCQELKDTDVYLKKQQEGYLLAKSAIKLLPQIISTQTLSLHYTAKDAQLLLLMSLISFPYATLKYKKTNKFIPMPFYLAFESLTFPEKVSNAIQNICESALQFQKLIKQNNEQSFDTVAKLIKNQGQTWELSLIVAQLYDQLANNNLNYQDYLSIKQFIYLNKLDKIYDLVLFIQVIQLFFHLFFYLFFPFFRFIISNYFYFVIQHYYFILKGKEIMDLFDLNKQGPIIGTIKDRIFLWQARNPDKVKDQLIEEIVENKDKFMK